ncbi:MAG: hypothetical protein ACPGJV_10390 [Bacteriovoracaceae bacterium]
MEQDELSMIYKWARTLINRDELAPIGYVKTKVCNTNEVGFGKRRIVLISHFENESLVKIYASGDYKFNFTIFFENNSFRFTLVPKFDTEEERARDVLLWINTEPELRSVAGVNEPREGGEIVQRRGNGYRIIKEEVLESERHYREAQACNFFDDDFVIKCKGLNLFCTE